MASWGRQWSGHRTWIKRSPIIYNDHLNSNRICLHANAQYMQSAIWPSVLDDVAHNFVKGDLKLNERFGGKSNFLAKAFERASDGHQIGNVVADCEMDGLLLQYRTQGQREPAKQSDKLWYPQIATLSIVACSDNRLGYFGRVYSSSAGRDTVVGSITACARIEITRGTAKRG